MRRILAFTLILMVLAGCAGAPSPVPTATPPVPIATPLPRLTPSPTVPSTTISEGAVTWIAAVLRFILSVLFILVVPSIVVGSLLICLAVIEMSDRPSERWRRLVGMVTPFVVIVFLVVGTPGLNEWLAGIVMAIGQGALFWSGFVIGVVMMITGRVLSFMTKSEPLPSLYTFFMSAIAAFVIWSFVGARTDITNWMFGLTLGSALYIIFFGIPFEPRLGRRGQQ